MKNIIDKELVEKLKAEWKSLWRERIDDKVRAEGLASTDYNMLFVEKGTVIFATRNFKMPTLREILEMHGVDTPEKFVQPNPHTGGWGKFIRTVLVNRASRSRARTAAHHFDKQKKKQQLKKGGRGWLHFPE